MSNSRFTHELASRRSSPEGRRWLFVPYDQLTDAAGPLSREQPRETGIVEICRSYGVRAFGEAPDCRESFFALTAERKLKHPAVLAIRNAAQEGLFANAGS